MECKGRVYRYTLSAYQSKDGGFHQNESFKLLKRKSCKGCNKCGWEEDWIRESLDEYGCLNKLSDFDDGDEAFYYLQSTTDYYGEVDVYSEGFKKCVTEEIKDE